MWCPARPGEDVGEKEHVRDNALEQALVRYYRSLEGLVMVIEINMMPSNIGALLWGADARSPTFHRGLGVLWAAPAGYGLSIFERYLLQEGIASFAPCP